MEISGRECLLYNEGNEPKMLLIQTLGEQERDSIDSEVAMISEATGASFVMADLCHRRLGSGTHAVA